MKRTWTPLAVFYLVVGIIGGVATWTFNVIAGLQGSTFVGDLFSNGGAVTSITLDVLFAAVVGGVFIVVEGRRQGMRRPWAYILCFGVAFAFALPLFLSNRERHIRLRESAGEEMAPPGRRDPQ